MLRYKLVTMLGMNQAEFVKSVQLYMDKGWKLEGGVSVSVTPADNCVWCQAMTREERTPATRTDNDQSDD